MKVQAILEAKGSDIVSIGPATTIMFAAGRLRLDNIAALVVLEDERMVGIVVERDIVRALSRHGVEVLHMQVAGIMTEPVTCAPTDDLKHVMGLMTRYRTRHLPVFDHGKLAGIVSIGDVVKHRLEELELETTVLRDAYLARR